MLKTGVESLLHSKDSALEVLNSTSDIVLLLHTFFGLFLYRMSDT